MAAIKFKKWSKDAKHISRKDRDQMALDVLQDLRDDPSENFSSCTTGDTMVIAMRFTDEEGDYIEIKDCKLRRRAEIKE